MIASIPTKCNLIALFICGIDVILHPKPNYYNQWNPSFAGLCPPWTLLWNYSLMILNGLGFCSSLSNPIFLDFQLDYSNFNPCMLEPRWRLWISAVDGSCLLLLFLLLNNKKFEPSTYVAIYANEIHSTEGNPCCSLLLQPRFWATAF
jgi:hypothetical protein